MDKNQATNPLICRDGNGIPHIQADSEIEMYYWQGYSHARDRGMQILLMRILGRGRLSEILDSSENSLHIDIFFRRMNWSGNTKKQIEALSKNALEKFRAYCEGINKAFDKKVPLELKLLGYKHETWSMDDSLLISRMIGYLTLAQSQGEIERLLVEMIQADVSDQKLEALFPGLLNNLDRELINKVELQERIVSNEVLWQAGVPRMMASNNWVVSGTKTKSGKPILSNDPHLEVNRLPNVWCEMSLSAGDNWSIGSGIPGVPGMLVGRNNNIAWGATYAFVDTIDSWVEKCVEGKYYREEDNSWNEFIVRKEAILRKNKETESISFYENDLGTLEGNPYEQQYCLITRWAAASSGAASVEAVLNMFSASTVAQGMQAFGQLETGWNYVFADENGDIGYQMTGLVPIRRKGISGLVPVPGWKKENHWQGFIDPKDMPRVKNPEAGYFCTANEDLNRYGIASPINMPMGSYRSDRISELLSSRSDLTSDDMFKMHFDVHSKQAALFMKILRPLLPNTEQGNILKLWDLCYDADSKGAYLFELFYKALYQNVFGKQGMSEGVVKFLQQETGTFIDFYANFDNILLSDKSIWFNGKSQQKIFEEALENAINCEIKTWKSVQQYKMKNILFDGKLPSILGFDKGPYTAIGGRATIHQGQIYRSAGRDTTFLPSFRMVADFSNDWLRTNIAGGPSDRRFSKWYCSDLDNWLQGRYKELNRKTEENKLPF